MTGAPTDSRGGALVWAAFIMLSLVWGSSYLFIRIGVKQLAPLPLVSGRLLIGALTLSLIAALRRQSLRLPARTLAILFVIAAVNSSGPFLLIAWGELSVPSGLASVLNSTVPIFSVILASVVLHDEPLTVTRLGGVAIGFAGVVVLLSRDLGHGLQWSALGGQLAIVLSSLCYAVGAVATRRTMRGVPSLTLAFSVVWMAALQTCVLSLIFSRPTLSNLHGDTVFAVLWLGILGSGVAYTLAYFILERWGASRYTLVAYMLPVTGLALGAIFLGEAIDWRILVGSILVFAGVFLAGMMARRPDRGAALDHSVEGRPAVSTDQ